MAKVNTNDFGLIFAVETSTGVLPASPQWRKLEPNDITEFGAVLTKVERRPISQQRGRRKSIVTDLEAPTGFETDFTMDALTDFAEGFMFSEFANVEFDLKSGGASPVPPPAVGTTDDFTIDAASVLLAGKMVFGAAAGRTLVFAKGYTTAGNNGLHELNADVASTDTTVQVASTLVTETPATNASLQVAGIRVSDGDLTFTKSGSTATLVSGGDVADWSVLGLRKGQYIHIGSGTTAGAVQNALNATATDDTYGYARITSISPATTLNLDKLDVKLAATANNTGEGDADILFGRYVRNLAVSDNSNDKRYLTRTYQFEGAYPELGGAGVEEYEYDIGQAPNELAFNSPLTDKSTLGFGFIGTNADDITTTRKTNATNAVGPLRIEGLATSSDLASLTTDMISLASDVCFQDWTVTVGNGVTLEKCQGTLGAVFVNAGQFTINLEGQMLFTNKQIINAIKNNDTVTFAAIMKNADGAVALDMPAATASGGGREFPLDQAVRVNITLEAFNDPAGTIPDVSLSLSLFPTVPTDRSTP